MYSIGGARRIHDVVAVAVVVTEDLSSLSHEGQINYLSTETWSRKWASMHDLG